MPRWSALLCLWLLQTRAAHARLHLPWASQLLLQLLVSHVWGAWGVQVAEGVRVEAWVVQGVASGAAAPQRRFPLLAHCCWGVEEGMQLAGKPKLASCMLTQASLGLATLCLKTQAAGWAVLRMPHAPQQHLQQSATTAHLPSAWTESPGVL